MEEGDCDTCPENEECFVAQLTAIDADGPGNREPFQFELVGSTEGFHVTKEGKSETVAKLATREG